jgi:hypothetical protein
VTESPTEAIPESDPAEVITNRPTRTAKDMVRSLVVLLIPVAVIVAIVWANGGNDAVVTDPGPVIAEAQAASFPVAAPHDLAADWKPITATYGDNTLRIGYVTPSGGGVQLVESTAEVNGLLIQELGDDTRPDGVVTAGAATWNAYQLHNGQRALVRTGNGRTIIVIGNADQSELAVLAAAVS